jgi:hypothetical protein
MAMRKRNCLAFADPGLRFRKNDGLLLIKEKRHIVRAGVRNISGRRVLILYFYNREKAAAGIFEPEYALFQRGDDYITLQRLEDGEVKWRKASTDNLGKSGACFTKTCAFGGLRDEQLVTRFCKIMGKTGFGALNALQAEIMAVRRTKRIMARERSIIGRMKPLPPVPRGLKGWIHREVLPHYVLYDYRGGGKPAPGYCTACRRDVLVNGAKHCKEGKCPRCGKAVTFKASGRAKRVWDRKTAQVLQKTGENELVLRIFKIYNDLCDWRKPKLTYRENARFFIRRTDGNGVRIEPYYYSHNAGKLTNWKKGTRPRFSSYQETFEGDICGYLYCKSLGSALAGTPWQYSQLDRFYQSGSEPMEVIPYLRAYLKYPAVEYLVKLGLTKLAEQIVYSYGDTKIINENGRTLREALGIGPEDLPVLQKVNADTGQLRLYQGLKKQGVRADERLLVWYRERGISSNEDVLLPLRYATPGKLMRYADAQYERLKDCKNHYGVRRYDKPSRVLSEYRDYLETGGSLGYDFTDSFVLFPKNLPEAHDQASKLYDTKKKTMFDEAIRGAYAGLWEQYCFTKDGLTLIPPETADEIVKEGHALRHCVHTYVERVAKGKCVILFVRRTENVKEPYFTVELSDGRVAQIRGQQNGEPPPEVQKFLGLWERKKLRPANLPAAA